MSRLRIQIASVPDRDNLVAELWDGDRFLAEVNQEHGIFEVVFYLKDGELSIPLSDAIDALDLAKKKLLGVDNDTNG